MTDQPVTITRKVWFSLLIPVLSLPVIAIAIGQYCLTDPVSFAIVSAVVLVGGASIYGVWVYRELGKQLRP